MQQNSDDSSVSDIKEHKLRSLPVLMCKWMALVVLYGPVGTVSWLVKCVCAVLLSAVYGGQFAACGLCKVVSEWRLNDCEFMLVSPVVLLCMLLAFVIGTLLAPASAAIHIVISRGNSQGVWDSLWEEEQKMRRTIEEIM